MEAENELMIKNLHRIEGQIRGIGKMIEEDRSCEDILTQLSAVNAAVSSIAKAVITHHLKHHLVLEPVASKDGDGSVDELLVMLDSYFKMRR